MKMSNLLHPTGLMYGAGIEKKNVIIIWARYIRPVRYSQYKNVSISDLPINSHQCILTKYLSFKI
jgi:hypothetical protein